MPNTSISRLCLTVLLLTLAAGAAQAQTPFSLNEARRIADQMQAAHDKLKDYTAIFYKQIRYEDGLSPREMLELKFQKPFKLYLKWLDGDNKGREAIFVKGRDEDRVWVHKGSFPDVTLCLDPMFCKDISGSRHPVTDAGMGFIIDLVRRDLARAAANPNDHVKVWDLGDKELFGRPSHCLETVTPVTPHTGYYAHRARVCYDRETLLPNKVTIWDHRDELFEDFGFAEVKINPGLSEKDFDPQNPAYSF